MNPTVTRIVELLFQDLAASEEVEALRAEVLTNCQDRFSDLTGAGMSEDDAISAVVESLRGMEEMLADYPRVSQDPFEKTAAAPGTQKEEDSRDHEIPEEIRRIEAVFRDADLIVRAGGEVSVNCHGNVRPEINNGVLSLRQERSAAGKSVHAIDLDISMNSFSDLMAFVGERLSRAVSDIASMSENYAEVTLPAGMISGLRAATTSGDVRWEGVGVEEAAVSTTSGDVTLLLPENCPAGAVTVESLSGDVSVEARTARIRLKTVSGDVKWSGESKEAEINSTSGDVEVRGRADSLMLKTVSGDMETVLEGETRLTVQSTSGDARIRLRELTDAQTAQISMRTVSGDAEVMLPHWMDTVSLQRSSRSGDCSIAQGLSEADNSRVLIEFSSVSGDLRIRKE